VRNAVGGPDNFMRFIDSKIEALDGDIVSIIINVTMISLILASYLTKKRKERSFKMSIS
jgi:hypothetical protein